MGRRRNDLLPDVDVRGHARDSALLSRRTHLQETVALQGNHLLLHESAVLTYWFWWRSTKMFFFAWSKFSLHSKGITIINNERKLMFGK